MHTWRNIKPALLCPVMKQAKSTCYAIAYVRQLEFHLKLHKQMPQDQHLSIQDFINLIPKDLLEKEGALAADDSLILPILKNGILLEKDCPLTENLCEKTTNLQGPRYHAKDITLHKLYPEGSWDISQKKYDDFHANLIEVLEMGVVAVGLFVYPSYSKLKHKHIYSPTKREWAGETPRYGHVMVCTGYDYDTMGQLFYEFLFFN